MSGRKRKIEDVDESEERDKQKKEDDDKSEDSTGADPATDKEEAPAVADNGAEPNAVPDAGQEPDDNGEKPVSSDDSNDENDEDEGGPSLTEDGATGDGVADKREKKKFRIQGSEKSGVLLFFGGTNWDLIGRREVPKNVKGAGGRNLWGPHRLTALKGIRVRTAVSGCAACHTVVITEEGRILTWGRNDKGQLGHGDTKRRDVPTYVEGLDHVRCVDAACGRSHTLVLTDRGHIFSFGDNKVGQCGVGNQTSGVLVPSKITFKGRPIAKLACGAEFSMMIDCKGFLFSFGSPEYGQLGHNTDGRYFVTSTKLGFRCEVAPRRVALFLEKTREGHIMPIDDVIIESVACGTNHTIAMDSKKRCYTWGFAGYGRLGHSDTKDEMIPRLLKFFEGPNRGINHVYAGGSFSMAISMTGCLFFWGQNKVAGEATMYPKPVMDLSGWNIRDVACSNRSIGVLADESVITWGPSPTYGELGYGENKPKSSTTAQEVKSLDGVHAHSLSMGYGHTVVIARDDTDDERAKLDKFPEYAP